MKKSSCILCFSLCFILVFMCLPLNILAFPGEPAGYHFTIDELIRIESTDVYITSSDGGQADMISRSDGTVLVEAYAYGGYAFSHWETYAEGYYLGTIANKNPLFDSKYTFSMDADPTQKYDPTTPSLRVNIPGGFYGQAYVYAVFVPGVNVRFSAEGNMVGNAKNLDRYDSNAGEYEYYTKDISQASFTANMGDDVSIDFLAKDSLTTVDKIYINGIDQTAQYPVQTNPSNQRHYVRINFPDINTPTEIRITTKQRDNVSWGISFNANGGTGTMPKQTLWHNKTCTLNKNTFTRDGYRFAGWNTNPGGNGTAFADEETFLAVHPDAGAGRISPLYAQWIPEDLVAPTAKQDLIYNGTAQSVIAAAGSIPGGTILYSHTCGTNGTADPDSIVLCEPGTHTVYYWVSGTNTAYPLEVKIQKAPLRITAKDYSYEYGSTPTNNGATFEGFVSQSDKDKALLTYTLDPQNRSITPALEGTSAALLTPYYDISYISGTLSVTPKQLTATWSNTEFTYDGSPHLPTVTLSGVLTGDDVSPIVIGEQTDAGTYSATLASLTGPDSANYTLPTNTTQSFTIRQAPNTSLPGATAEDETINGKADGRLVGVDETMEYRKEGENTYTPIPAGAASLEGLQSGTYFIRHKETKNFEASAELPLTIAPGRDLKVQFMQGTTLIETRYTHYNGTVPLPKVPGKEGFYGRWDHDGKNITEDTVITALYSKAPPTGDSGMFILYIALVVLSGAGLALLLKHNASK